MLLLLLFLLLILSVEQRSTQTKSNAFDAGNCQPWYQTPAIDGMWTAWNDNGHTPPHNWFSEYIPEPYSGIFDPTADLYSSRDDKIIYWQLQKLAEAKQEIAISSWWGQGHKTDIAFRHIITDVMNRQDNPYPNLRWVLYYEPEGYGSPFVDQIVNDLTYVKTNYTNQPAYLKIHGAPVIFVYNAAHDGSNPLDSFARWRQVRAQTGFYVVMKVDPLAYGVNPADMDGWHEYAPAAGHYMERLPYYAFVSPGFWLNGQAERLPRDPEAFEAAVKQLVASTATWKFTETWNEWGEGTAVEPGEQVNQTTSGNAVLKTDGYAFGNLYVDILHRNLPPLPQGTGATIVPTETIPMPTVSPTVPTPNTVGNPAT